MDARSLHTDRAAEDHARDAETIPAGRGRGVRRPVLAAAAAATTAGAAMVATQAPAVLGLWTIDYSAFSNLLYQGPVFNHNECVIERDNVPARPASDPIQHGS